MSDRLSDLRRQRALAQEQVAWFDREIARESGAVPAPVSPVQPQPAAPTPLPIPADPSPADAERILEEYQSPPGSLQSEVRRGCLLYVFAAFALVGLVAALWFIFRRGD